MAVRNSQTTLDVVTSPKPNVRISQEAIEGVISPLPSVLSSQYVLEVVTTYRNTSIAHLSQFVLEVLVPSSVTPPVTGRIFGPAAQCM